MMRKITVFLLLPLALIVLGANLYINVSIRKAIEEAGTQITAVPVRLVYSSLSFISGDGGLGPMQIGNPPGFKGKNAVEIKGFEVSSSIFSLFSDRITVDELIIEAPVFFMEKNEAGRNIDLIAQQIQRAGDPAKAGIYTLVDSAADARSSIAIRHIYIKEGKLVQIGANGLEDKNLEPVSLPDVKLEIAEQLSPAEAVARITEAVMAALPHD